MRTRCDGDGVSWEYGGVGANEIVNGYVASAKNQCPKKSKKHETWLQENVNVLEKYIWKVEKMAEEKQMENLFNQLVEGKSIYELDARETKGLLKLFDVKQSKLGKRKKQFNEQVDDNVLNKTGANDSIAGGENDGHP
ncbi:putative late blight resistance protein -like protein R1B-14-like [Capsicum annuum]|nr:putative late blight resistance protein -like protein R1B-14-like [Capsicum annuum]